MRTNSTGLIAIAIALLCSTIVASRAWKEVRQKPYERTIAVTGSAKKRINSDLIEWSATVDVGNADRTAAYRTLHEHVDKTVAFLTGKGIKPAEIVTQSVTFQQQFETERRFEKEERIEKQIAVGWLVEQTIFVRSLDVARVETVSREVTSLLEQGISVRSATPAYFYTKLGELKVEMLAAAAKDARMRAEQIVKSAGGASIGALVGADMGVININPANSSTTSWEGNNDTSSMEKDILTIVHTKFVLE